MENDNINVEKKTKGRQKIEIKKIDKKSARQVTFSKRWSSGLFNKAGELCVLCGVEAAVITFTPAGKSVAFGHPSVDTILDRYLNGSTSREVSTSGVEESKKRYVEALAELGTEKKRGEMINVMVEARGYGFWWDESIEGLELQDLEQYVASMEKLKKKVAARADEMEKASASPSNFLALDMVPVAAPTERGESKGIDD